MNERIKQLVEQCEEHPYALHTIDLEKFAELIVKECSSICYKSFENGDEIAGLLMQTFGVDNE